MAYDSGIEWTESTWNPVSGCSKVSPGCKHCYAERMALRLQAMGHPHYADGFRPTLHPDSLLLPLQWKRPRLVFVNSMSDLFHEAVPEDFIQKVFSVMGKARWHTFQVLTKRAARLRELDGRLDWPPNVWMGVSVEDQERISRIDDLRLTRAQTRFLSLEPLIGPIEHLDLTDIHWVIAGGESGPRSRPMDERWVVSIRDQCQRNGVPFFFKQWGGVHKKRAGRILEGRTWDEFPSRGAGITSAKS